MARWLRRAFARSPLDGDIKASRVAWLKRTPSGFPFPHLRNYRRPLEILDAIFWQADKEIGGGRHNRFLAGPFNLSVGFVTRDPGVIKAILLATGDKPGQFDRDPWPAGGIARATGADTLLYANGPRWRVQKRVVAAPFAASALFRPEIFQHFEETFRAAVLKRLDAFGARYRSVHPDGVEIELETEISTVMLEMLVNDFFGGNVSFEEVRERYVPSIQALIEDMVRDTLGFRFLGRSARSRIRRWKQDFEDLVDIALKGRHAKRGAWAKFESDLPDGALRPNLRVFLAGALEATTSLASWAMSHLSKRPDLQARIYDEVKDLSVYDPENLARCPTLNDSVQETLRLTPALYFLPRIATADTWIQTDDGRRLFVPKRTHVILDVWHANREEEFWGVAVTGYPARIFEPDRWRFLAEKGVGPQEMMHFGFGHGARVCPGKFLGLLEVGLVVGGIVKVFRVWPADGEGEGPAPAKAIAGVSTKPAGKTRVRMKRRDPWNEVPGHPPGPVPLREEPNAMRGQDSATGES